MIVWLGGRSFDLESLRMLEAGGVPYYINSFVGMSQKKMDLLPASMHFFLDSGAFSAWTRKIEIDLDSYCAFIRTNIERLDVYVALDVIAALAKFPERIKAAEKTRENFHYMQREGLNPMPVFHCWEPYEYLQHYIDQGCDYIGIGGLVSVPATARREWLDRIFTFLQDYPHIKTHGFGMTSMPLLFRYPWHSVDSTAWMKFMIYGSLAFPAMRDGAFIFDQPPRTVFISEGSAKAKRNGAHANSMSYAMRELLDRWLAECGYTYEQVAEDHFARAVANIHFFKRAAESRSSGPWAQSFATEGLFS